MATERPSHADPSIYRELAGFEGDWRETWWNRDFLALISDRFTLAECPRVLDVGCGAGHWGQTLLPHLSADAKLVGVDKEASFVEMATARAVDKGLALQTEYSTAEAEQLPFDDHSFDLVTCQTVLIHIADVRAAIAEMVRVTRPGGRLLLVEPDNVATTAGFYTSSVPLEAEQLLELLQLQLICERGKRALGEGDSSVGAHLPGLLHAAGVENIRAFGSDKCALQVPPYQVADQAIDLREQLRFAGLDCWLQTGTREDSLRLYTAGGGTHEAFDRHWALVQRWLRAFERQVRARTFTAARGVCMYLVGGRTPPG